MVIFNLLHPRLICLGFFAIYLTGLYWNFLLQCLGLYFPKCVLTQKLKIYGTRQFNNLFLKITINFLYRFVTVISSNVPLKYWNFNLLENLFWLYIHYTKKHYNMSVYCENVLLIWINSGSYWLDYSMLQLKSDNLFFLILELE